MSRLLVNLSLYGVVAMAALRLWRLWPRLPLDELVKTLRAAPDLPRPLRRPEIVLRVVNRWLRWLPPRGLRSCLKRSLLLLDLWSRCGLEPEFHLGMRGKDDEREGHAWVTAEGVDHLVDDAESYSEAWTG